MRADLIHDLQGLLLAAFELGDYNSVKKFAGYLEELTNEGKAPTKAAPGRPRKATAAKPAKPAKAAKAVKAAKIEKVAKAVKAAKAAKAALPEETAELPKAPKKAKKAPKKAKAPKKIKAPKPPKKETAKRGAAKFELGTKLGANLKGTPLEMTIVEGGFQCGELLYPSLRALIDAIAGEKQAMHLRYIGNWKVIA